MMELFVEMNSPRNSIDRGQQNGLGKDPDAMLDPQSLLIDGEFDAGSVGATVEFRVLAPRDRSPTEGLPLVLQLHGAMSSAVSLDAARPLYDQLRVRGLFPRAIVACASTPTRGGFYIDRPEAAWETLIGTEFVEHLAQTYGPFTRIALIGASMGGYGALKIAFAEPERFVSVAAISPAVFPGETAQDVPMRNIPSILGEFHDAMSGGTCDPAVYAANSVYARARANRSGIQQAALKILVDCGAEDEFLLHEGAAYLHRVLAELGIRHEYRLVEGAGHLGSAVQARTMNAIRFIGNAISIT
jgi:S-formylglutathione hydrolase